ncbi:MAG TPA: hypothetical protein VN899_08840 [Stellaceae bacterium]|jgi:Ca2+/H+ antiporter|nr:hypothetical protein [Stellaceae bacterium]
MPLVKYTRRQPGRKERMFMSGMWMTSAASVIAGFFLRLLASFMHRSDVRLGGVALIALGLLIAMLAAAAESLSRRRSR